MNCPACDARPKMTDTIVCGKCYRHAKDLAAAHGFGDEADDTLLPPFVVWAAQIRKSGESVNLAVMLECRQAPRAVTDDTFMRGWARTGGEHFETLPEVAREAYMQPARDAGVSVTGKKYFSSLAAFPGDPEAWVSDRGEARRLVEKRGWSCPELGVGPSQDLDVQRRPGKLPSAGEYFREKIKTVVA